MIPKAFIIAWQKRARWQRKQDLIFERTPFETHSNPFNEMFVFLKGTTLYKIFFPGLHYDAGEAYEFVKKGLLEKI